MTICVFAGKGGVGKTTSAVAYAKNLAHYGQSTVIIDYDGGHSVGDVLGIEWRPVPNTIEAVGKNLWLAVIEPFNYKTIVEAEEAGWDLGQYLAQFPEHLGIVPWADMLFHFFGAPTDVEGTQKFAILCRTLATLKRQGDVNVIIDVEPTAGLQRLLVGSGSTIRSLKNLSQTGKLMLMVLGAKWPDIKGYLTSEYFQKIDYYCADMQQMVEALVKAMFFLVCTPELAPIHQTFNVRKIVEGFGGKAYGCIVNGTRQEPHEAGNIALLNGQGLPIVKIKRRWELHGTDPDLRSLALLEIGQTISELVKKSQ